MGDSNKIHKGAPVQVMPFFVKRAFALTFNSRMSTTAHIDLVVCLISSTEPQIQNNLLRSYLVVVNYLFKMFANDQEIAEMDFKNLRYIQPADMASIQYDNYLNAKSCEIKNVYDESTLNVIFIEGINSSICHSIQE